MNITKERSPEDHIAHSVLNLGLGYRKQGQRRLLKDVVSVNKKTMRLKSIGAAGKWQTKKAQQDTDAEH